MSCPACGEELRRVRSERDAAVAEADRLRELVVALQARLAAVSTGPAAAAAPPARPGGVPQRRGLASLITPAETG